MTRSCLLALLTGCALCATAAPLPIDPLWKSESFRRAFTASYGVDARIEPRISPEEKSVLDAVAAKMAAQDRPGAIAALTSSPLTRSSAPLLFTLGNLRFESGDPASAIEQFRAALALYPNFRDAHRNLAVALVQHGSIPEAEPSLIRALELGAQDGLTFGLLGYCHLAAERHAAALQAYRMAQMTMPAEIQWKTGEAECLLALGATREAESLFASLLELRPTDTGLWLHQANVWLTAQEPAQAAANLEFVRRLQALPASGLITLGHLYLNLSLHSRALSAWQDALAHDPPADASSALSALDRLTQLSLWPEARSFATQITSSFSLTPDSPAEASLHRSLGLIELESGDPIAGQKLVAALVERNPLDAQALLLLARFHARQGGLEEAILLLEQAAQDPDTAPRALLFHGQLLVEARDFAAAIPLFEAVLQRQPDPHLQTYLEELRRLTSP